MMMPIEDEMVYAEEIAGYLVNGEIVKKAFWLRSRSEIYSYRVWVSNKRLFIKEGNSISDVPYDQISEIELKRGCNWISVTIGLILLTVALIALAYGSVQGWRLVAGAILFFGIGFFRRPWFVKIIVEGRSHPMKLSGSRSELDWIQKTFREKKSKKEQQICS